MRPAEIIYLPISYFARATVLAHTYRFLDRFAIKISNPRQTRVSYNVITSLLCSDASN